MKVAEQAMGKVALEQFIELNIFCLTKIPLVDRMWNGEDVLTDRELVDLRSIDSGAPHQFFLVLVGAEAILTDELKNDSDYIGLNKEAAIHVTLVNDLYSLRKELDEERYKLNYVYVKMKNNNIDEQTAVNEIIIEIMESDRMARVYGENLKTKSYRNISRYVEGIYAAMGGNHYWSTICRRYNKL